MASFVSALMTSACRLRDQAYHLMHGYNLPATPANLAWLFKQDEAEMLKYTFVDAAHTRYSPLMYAVLLEDITGVQILLSHGAETWTGSQMIVSFYIQKCAEKRSTPHIGLFNLLLEHIDDINVLDSQYLTILEHALSTMCPSNTLHWEVIKSLFNKQISIYSTTHDVTSFTFLFSERLDGKITWNVQEESAFLENLCGYVTLERHYYPSSKAFLSVANFRELSPRFQASFQEAAHLLKDCVSGSKETKNTLTYARQQRDLLEKKHLTDHEKATDDSLIDWERLFSTLNGVTENGKERVIGLLSEMVPLYHRYFKTLVQKGSFKDCLDPVVLASLQSALELEKETSPSAKTLLDMLASEGF
jgi:hypothetical protein